MLDLFAHDARLRARVDNLKGARSIGIIVQPPPSGTVRFATTDFALRDSVSQSTIPIRSVAASGGRPVTVPVADMLYVTVDADNLENHQAFELQLPTMLINESEAWQSPVIRFQRKTWTGIEVLCGP